MSTRTPHFLLVLFANSKEIHIFATDGVTSVPIFEGKRETLCLILCLEIWKISKIRKMA